MFDVTSSKLLLLGIVALIVIGPKDLPVLLRTVGKYVGIIRRQATEFRAQFEEAVRESELDQLKKDVEAMGSEAEASMRDAERNVTAELDAAKGEVERAAEAVPDKSETAPLLEDASSSGAHELNGASPHAASEVAPETARDEERTEQKAGA